MFAPAQGAKKEKRVNKSSKNVHERETNAVVQKAFHNVKEKTGSETSLGQSYLEVLKVSLPDVPESAFNRSKVIVIGKKESKKDEIIQALFGLQVTEDLDQEHSKIILGRFDAEDYKEVKIYNSRRITTELWNWTYEASYNYLQHLYLTDCSLYLVVFDTKAVLSADEKQQDKALTYLEKVLRSKKLHAPDAPVLLVGSNAAGLGPSDIKQTDRILLQRLIQTNSFHVTPLKPGHRFAAIDTASGSGVGELKKRITGVIKAVDYVKELVPKTILQAEEILHGTNEPYLLYSEVRKLLTKIGINDDDLCEVLLKVMAERGIITFLHDYQRLRRVVVLDPSWLIRACSIAIYNEDQVNTEIDFDINNKTMNEDYNRFVFHRVITRDFLCHVLLRMNYPKEVHDYLVDLMRGTCMIADYLYEEKESYLCPNFYEDRYKTSQIKDDQYSGPYFVIDFSGVHNQTINNDGGKVYATYMPHSFYEKLVSLAIHLSASFGQGIKPITEYKKARLSFGSRVSFMMSVIKETNGRTMKIKVATHKDTPQKEAVDLLERIFSMARGIRKDFYPGVPNKATLAMCILVPAKDNSWKSLTDYGEIQKAKKNKVTDVMQNFNTPGKIAVTEFDHWTREGRELKLGNNVTFKPDRMGEIPLKPGKKFHCYVTYRYSAEKIINKQLEDIKTMGYKCWFHTENENSLDPKVFTKAISDSSCLLLLLSVDVWSSPIVIQEVEHAIKAGVKIILLHHPDTDNIGYWPFSQYIATCPDNFKQIFDEVESIPLQRRFYLQESVTNQVAQSIEAALKK